MNLALALILALLIHEGGHVAACKALGLRITRVGINWTGPFIAHETSKDPMDNAAVSLAGPLANLVLAFTLADWHQAAHVNLAMGLINLLVIPGSDGLRIYRQLRHIGG